MLSPAYGMWLAFAANGSGFAGNGEKSPPSTLIGFGLLSGLSVFNTTASAIAGKGLRIGV